MIKVKVENVDNTESEKPKLNKKRTKEAISVLKKLNEVFSDNKTKKSLLDDSSESSVYLQVTLKKIPPKKLKSMIKVHLPHSLMTDNTEVCLITGDLEKNNKKAEIEPTVLHYKEFLKKNDVTGIAEVVPLRQLRTEYKTFESKRQLSAAYDMFINDKKITGCLPKLLGKAFYDNRKFPIPINLATSNLKEQIERAVSETVFNLSCRGNSCTSEVARLSMENVDILENILSCIDILAEKLPGKWTNVLGLYIKTAKSEAIPIYMSFDNPNELKIKAPRHNEKVKAEELSTVRNAEVKVFKDGRLIVKNLPDSEDESNEEEDVKPETKTMKTEVCNDISDNELNVEDPTAEENIKPKNRRKKAKMQDSIKEADKDIEEDVTNEANFEPKMKTKVLVNDVSDNEVNVDDFTTKTNSKPKNKRKTKIQAIINEADSKDIEENTTNEANVKPKGKKMKTKVLVNDVSDNEVNVEDFTTKANVKPKNKRKKTQMDASINEADVALASDIEDDATNEANIKPKIKKMKNKVPSNAVLNEVNMVYSITNVGVKPKDKRKKINKLVKNIMDNDKDQELCANEVDLKPGVKRRKGKVLVRNASNIINETTEKDSTNEADIKPKNKRKNTKELVDNTSDNKVKVESCADEVDVLPKIKRRKTKDASIEIDSKKVVIMKRKTNKRNNKM